MISYKKLYLGIIIPAIIICITACAVVQPLSGGNKDVTSPTLHYSLPGINAVNVSEQKFAFVFSEEIALSNFYKNININPYYPSKNIKTFIRGKKLTLTFLEPLNSNTTYNIDFGKSVVDVTEKNPALNLNYTFSTGAEIDTLIYEGILLDNLTHKPSANTLVTLREKGNISADTTLPSYTTLTNTTGNFSFHGLVNKEFTVQAYTDLNNNKMFDKTTEQLAILDHSIFTSEENNDTLYLFKPRTSQTKMKAPTFGESYMDVSFTSGIKELISTSEKSYHVLNDNKTIRFYAPDNKTELSVVALDSFNLKIDTTITYTYRPETITEKLIDITGFIDRE